MMVCRGSLVFQELTQSCVGTHGSEGKRASTGECLLGVSAVACGLALGSVGLACRKNFKNMFLFNLIPANKGKLNQAIKEVVIEKNLLGPINFSWGNRVSLFCVCSDKTIGILVLNKGMSGFTSYTVWIPKQVLLRV